MASDQVPCPSCGSAMHPPLTGGRMLCCSSCGGRLMGLIPFEHLLADGVGAHVWTATAEASGEPGPRCSYCFNPMRHPSPDGGAPKDLAVCRTCQQVWLPATAEQWVQANASASAAPGAAGAALPAAPPANCPTCGAPFEPDPNGTCHFCHAQIVTQAPEPEVVFVPTPMGGLGGGHPGFHTGSRLLDIVADALTQPVNTQIYF